MTWCQGHASLLGQGRDMCEDSKLTISVEHNVSLPKETVFHLIEYFFPYNNFEIHIINFIMHFHITLNLQDYT